MGLFRGRVEVRAAGVADVEAALRAVRRAGGPELRRKLYRGLTVAANPMIEAAKANASTLPGGGGRGVRHYTLKGRRQGVAQLVKGELRTSGRVRRSTGQMGVIDTVADRVRASRFKVTARSGKDAGVRIVAAPRKGRSVDLDAMDRRGVLRHPLFGNRDHWYSQSVTPGWFVNPMRANVDAAREEIAKVVDEVVRELAGKG